MNAQTHPVDEMLPPPKLFTLGLQHVLVMYAGAVVVPLIIGRALKLDPEHVALLISADLFCCGLVSLIQSFGLGKLAGIKLPVMMGVSFAAVGPMLAMAAGTPGVDGARLIFGSVIGAGIFGILVAPFVSRLLRYFPPVVTGSIILVIGITLMRVGINWIFGNPFGPTAPQVVNPDHLKWLGEVNALASSGSVPEMPKGLSLSASVNNPNYASVGNIVIAGIVLATILIILRYAKGFMANIAVLTGIVVGGVITAALGMMHFDKVAKAQWFDWVTPFSFGVPIFDAVAIFTMCIVMLVVMVESIGMFLALGEMTDRKIDTADMTRGLRADGLGALLGGIFNTFPYTSFSQNVGLVGVTGVQSRYVCVAGGLIMVVLGLLPKMAALVEALPIVVLGGSGLVMFGMVAATGIRILSAVDFKGNRNNLLIVALSLGFGMIPLIAPNFKQWLPHGLHPMIESGIVLCAIVAIVLNVFFNGSQGSADGVKQSAAAASIH